MNEKFKMRIEELPLLFEKLLMCRQITRNDLSSVPSSGVYIFIENETPIYVGRTDRMKARLDEHGSEKSSHNKASFAFKLAKEEAKKDGIDVKRKRADLTKDQRFADIFRNQRKRVSIMKIKYVEITDAINQCLFEVYASEELSTPHNDFKNH